MWYAILGAVLLAGDQILKYWVVTHLAVGGVGAVSAGLHAADPAAQLRSGMVQPFRPDGAAGGVHGGAAGGGGAAAHQKRWCATGRESLPAP